MPADKPRQLHRDFLLNPSGDPRVAASVVLVGMVAVLIGAVFMAIGPPLKANAPAARAASNAAQTAPVRMIGVPVREDACAQQTWPNIEQRCLVPVKKDAAADTRPGVMPNEDAKLSPLTATTAVKIQPNAQDATTDPTPPDNTAASTTQNAPAPVTRAETTGFANDEMQEPPVRKRVRRHSGFFFLPFGFRH